MVTSNNGMVPYLTLLILCNPVDLCISRNNLSYLLVWSISFAWRLSQTGWFCRGRHMFRISTRGPCTDCMMSFRLRDGSHNSNHHSFPMAAVRVTTSESGLQVDRLLDKHTGAKGLLIHHLKMSVVSPGKNLAVSSRKAHACLVIKISVLLCLT